MGRNDDLIIYVCIEKKKKKTSNFISKNNVVFLNYLISFFLKILVRKEKYIDKKILTSVIGKNSL